MAGTELALDHEPLDGGGKLEKPDRVGHRGTGSTHPLGHLVLRQREVLDELLIRRRLLEWVQVLAVQVLHHRGFQASHVVGGADERGDGGKVGPFGRPPPSLPRDQLVVAVLTNPHDDRLDDPHLRNRRGECRQGLLVEVLPGLIGVRNDLTDVDLAVDGAFGGDIGRDQRAETLSQSTTLRHRAPPLPVPGTRWLPETSDRTR